MFIQETIRINTKGRGIIDISPQVMTIVANSMIECGLCNLFIQHTSASLILCENADPTVQTDLATFMERLVRDGDSSFQHRAEGADDMSAHIRTVLTSSSITIPVAQGRCLLGTWQGIYIWEHRYAPHNRSIILTLHGEKSTRHIT